MGNNFAIKNYLDADKVTKELDALIKKPIYSIKPEALKKYEREYYAKKCAKSKEMIDIAKQRIPGGVQHNLAFNYPFPLVFTKASGNKLYDIDGNEYYDFLQAGGPTIIGSNPPEVREKVIELLNDCGPSTGLFHEYEYKLANKIAECVPSVEMFRMLGSGTEACMCAVRVARLATKHKNILKMGGAYHGWSDQLAYGMRVPGTKNLQSRGVPMFVFKHTDEFFPNDLNDLERKLKKNELTGGTAGVFIEPRLLQASESDFPVLRAISELIPILQFSAKSLPADIPEQAESADTEMLWLTSAQDSTLRARRLKRQCAAAQWRQLRFRALQVIIQFARSKEPMPVKRQDLWATGSSRVFRSRSRSIISHSLRSIRAQSATLIQ